MLSVIIVGFLWYASTSNTNEASKVQSSSPVKSTASEPSSSHVPSSLPASTQSQEIQAQTRSTDFHQVSHRLYIDSPDMEEIIEANLRLKASDYGFEIVPVRSQADVVLEGSAGVLKQGGFLGSCAPFYGFDVVQQLPKHRRKFKLTSGVPNDLPCIRVEVARQILGDLRTRLDSQVAGK